MHCAVGAGAPLTVPLPQDYKGQLLAENLYYIIIILFGVRCSDCDPVFSGLYIYYLLSAVCCAQIVAWIAGYMDDNFYTAVNGWLGGLALAVVVSDVGMRPSLVPNLYYYVLGVRAGLAFL